MPSFHFRTPSTEALFSERRWVAGMLRFEEALARAEAEAGVIPKDAAAAIAACCRIDLFDPEAIMREALLAGTPAIPLVRLLVERAGGEAGRFVHWGATSQDCVDTATILLVREALSLLDGQLMGVAHACASLAERQRRTPMAGRTLLQHAAPITFGLKAARWLALVVRRLRALRALRPAVEVVQLGGAVGTLASLGDKGGEVTRLLAAELGLGVPDLPWHAERDRFADLAAFLGVTAGSVAKIAGDLLLLAQSEVGEVAEGSTPGKGGSSAMPQKQNPIDATIAVAAARHAIGLAPLPLAGMAQEHERAAGGWQAEWAALPEIFTSTITAVERLGQALSALRIDDDRMRTNLEASGGLIMAESLSMALAARAGRVEAQRLVRSLCDRVAAEGITLLEATLQDEQATALLPAAELARVLDPAHYLGSTDRLIDNALDAFRVVTEE